MTTKRELLDRIEKLEHEMSIYEIKILEEVKEMVRREVEHYFNSKCVVAVEGAREGVIKAEVRRKLECIKNNFDKLVEGDGE